MDYTTYAQRIPQQEALFQLVFRRSLHPKFLKWRYLDAPNQDILACIVSDGDRLIANYSASPCTLQRDEVRFPAALSMTTMTDPDFAGRGLFTALAKRLYEEMATRGYQFIFGFPNHNSHHGFIKRLNWMDIYEIPTMSRLVDSVPMTKNEPNTDNQFGLDYSGVVQPSGLLHVAKDGAYLRWRYARHPTNRYVNFVVVSGSRVSSFCVVKQYENFLDVVDLRGSSPEETEYLLMQAMSYARSKHLSRINCWAPRHHFIHPTCERLGFQNGEPITYFGAAFLGTSDPGSGSFANYSSWYIQMGDSDVY